MESKSWEDAIFYYRRAEEISFPKAVSLAAKAATNIVQLLVSLGDYRAAREEIKRTQEVYERIQNLETNAELCRLEGWLDFYSGKLSDAKAHFEEQLKLARDAGIEYFERSAHGFLARIDNELAKQATSTKDRATHFYWAKEHAEADCKFFIREAWPEAIALSQFRLSQVYQASGSYIDAKNLRKKVRDMRGTNPFPHLDLEEARLHLKESAPQLARFLAERALDYFRNQKYARGISEAHHILAFAARAEGDLTAAYELAVAALCAAPSDTDIRGEELWKFVSQFDKNTLGKGERYEEYFQLMQEAAINQQGNFKYLKYITFLDSSDDLHSILSQLSPKPDLE